MCVRGLPDGATETESVARTPNERDKLFEKWIDSVDLAKTEPSISQVDFDDGQKRNNISHDLIPRSIAV